MVSLLSLMGCKKKGIHEVVATRTLTDVQEYVRNDPDCVNYKDAKGETPIFYATDFEVARFLINRGADVKLKVNVGNEGYYPIHMAARKGLTSIVWLLLENGVSPDQLGGMTEGTPLMAAASNGHIETSYLSLEKGANPLIVDTEGRTAVECALTDDAASNFGYADGAGGTFRARRRIVSGRFANQGHFVIVDGLNKANHVIVRDPATATKYFMSLTDFAKHQTGQVVWKAVK